MSYIITKKYLLLLLLKNNVVKRVHIILNIIQLFVIIIRYKKYSQTLF